LYPQWRNPSTPKRRRSHPDILIFARGVSSRRFRYLPRGPQQKYVQQGMPASTKLLVTLMDGIGMSVSPSVP
jgi:hypothetical protein